MDSETAEAHGKLVEKAALSLESASQSQPQGASLLPASTVGAGWTVWCTLVAAIRLIADVILRAYMLYYTPNRNIVPKLGDVWAKKQNGIPELTAFGDTLSYCNSVLRSCRHRCVRPIEQSQAVFREVEYMPQSIGGATTSAVTFGLKSASSAQMFRHAASKCTVLRC